MRGLGPSTKCKAIVAWAVREIIADREPRADEVPSVEALHEWTGRAPLAVLEAVSDALGALVPVAGARWQVTQANLPFPYTGAVEERIGFVALDAGGNLVDRLSLLAVHARWKAAAGAEVEHPIVVLVEGWLEGRPKPVEPYTPTSRASLPRLHRVTAAEARTLPALPDSEGARPALPDIEVPGVRGCPSWLLRMFDAASGSLGRPRHGGAPWPMRLFIGALIHLPIPARDGGVHSFQVATEEVIAWLHPDGWANRRRDWHRLPEALFALNDRHWYLPVPGFGYVKLVTATVIPETPGDPFVEFTVRVPASAAHGARIDWPRLCRYGVHSALMYRAYLSVSALLDHSARRGHPITADVAAPLVDEDGRMRRAKGGRLLRSGSERVPNPAAHYVPVLSDADLTGMLGLDASDRRRRHDARKAIEALAGDGVIRIEEVPGHGVRLFGPSRERV